jgi:hypothetical protein
MLIGMVGTVKIYLSVTAFGRKRPFKTGIFSSLKVRYTSEADLQLELAKMSATDPKRTLILCALR